MLIIAMHLLGASIAILVAAWIEQPDEHENLLGNDSEHDEDGACERQSC